MILEKIKYDVTNLLHSDNSVALCRLEGDALRNLYLDVREWDWTVMVAEGVSGEHWLVFAIGPARQGNLVGAVREWTRNLGFQFFVKAAADRWETPRPNTFTLPNGVEVQISAVFSRCQNNTQYILSQRDVLPEGYLRI
ncbi:MAG TPA: hypothetical protein VMB03_06350 [Bryobacteraceae bacterium]|nr:hypothetical protein [Bryobacteraceae bacterium]